MVEFEQNGQTYRVGLIDAFDQILVARKLAPILGALLDAKDNISKSAESISNLEDESANVVFNVLLKVVQRKSGKTYANIIAPPANKKDNPIAMFDDLDGGELILILVESMKVNMGKPLATLQSKLKESKTLPE